MANQKSNEKEGLYTLLRSHGFDPVMRDTTGGVVPVSDDAEVFQFNFDAEGDNAPVTVSIDEDNKLVIYYGDEVKQTGSEESWYSLLKELKRYAQGHQLSFQLKNKDHLRYDMAKRTHMKKVDESKTNEGLADDVADMARGMKNKDGSPRFANVRQGKPPVKPAGKATAPVKSTEKGATSPADWYDQASGGRRYTGDSKVPTGTMVEGSGPKEKQKRPFQSLDQMRDTAKQKSEKNKQDKKASAAEKIGKKQVEEGYYATGRKSSYSDAVPQVKIILQHSRQLEEGERRYRAIERIFVENAAGERFLLDTTKPGLARVYARHIAEGGTPYDEQGKHIHSLCEEYTKMAGFVRATRNGQFNESTQSLVNEGVNHYNNLRETLHKMAGRRGYNAYFESWTPTLTEDEDSTDLSEMFASTELDPRIESVMPILRKLNKNITEVDHSAELAEWADDVIDESLGLAEVSKGLATKAYAKRSRDAFDQSDYATNADDHKSAEDASNKADKTYDRIGKRWGKDAQSSADKAANKEIFGNEKIAEVSNDLLGRYKKKAGEQSSAADKAGNFEKGHKRFKGIVKATLKQFANDKPKQVDEGDGLESNNPEGIPEGEFAGKFKTGKAGQWTNKGQKANKPAQVGDLVGACESVEDTGNDRLYGYPEGSENSRKFRQYRKEAEYYCTGPSGKILIPAVKYHIQQRVRGMDKGQAEVLTAKNFGDEINTMYEATKKPDFAKKFQKNLDQTKKKADDTKEKVEQHQKEVKEGVDHLAHILKLAKG